MSKGETEVQLAMGWVYCSFVFMEVKIGWLIRYKEMRGWIKEVREGNILY